MTIEEFRKQIIEGLNERYSDAYDIIPQDVLKNNGRMYCGICIREAGKNIAPTIYLEDMYKRFDETGDMDELLDLIIEIKRDNSIDDVFEPNFYMQFDNIKDDLFVKLINHKNNMELLVDTPYREFLDMALVIYCDVTKQCGMLSSIMVKNNHVDVWKVDEDRLFEIAVNNTRKRGVKTFDMGKDLLNFEDEKVDEDDLVKMIVLTNERGQCGASVMTFDSELDKYCKEFDSGLYIIPSSIHEVIIVPEDRVTDVKSLNSLIADVNRNELEWEDILSDHAYYYSVNSGYACV